MENAIKHLAKGFNILDSIELRLKGEEIDRIAIARQEFRNAYAILAELTKKNTQEEKTDG